MRLYKMEVYVYDFEDTDPADVIDSIESNRYRVVKVLKSENVGLEWHDDHELNKRADIETHRKYFQYVPMMAGGQTSYTQSVNKPVTTSPAIGGGSWGAGVKP